MERQDGIVALCQEAGDSGPEEALVDTWEADHAYCCALHVDDAARGDITTLNLIRTCMGILVTQ